MAANVRRLREEQRLTLDQLSKRLVEVGRPILASGLSKIEQGDRRVDVDDLVALALALDVSPSRLLLTAQARSDAKIDLAGSRAATERSAWQWAAGEQGLGSSSPIPFDSLLNQFPRINRPHDPPDEVTGGELLERAGRGEFDDLWKAYRAVKARTGLPAKAVQGFISLMETFDRVSYLTSLMPKPKEPDDGQR